MADDVDRAQEVTAMVLAQALSYRKNSDLKKTGTCHNCGEHLADPPGLFCDDACEQDYQRLRRMRSQRLA